MCSRFQVGASFNTYTYAYTYAYACLYTCVCVYIKQDLIDVCLREEIYHKGLTGVTV